MWLVLQNHAPCAMQGQSNTYFARGASHTLYHVQSCYPMELGKHYSLKECTTSSILFSLAILYITLAISAL